jgi:tRNA pseudouridine38-40 synthase
MGTAVLDREIIPIAAEGVATPAMTRVAMIVEYDGSRYAGSQYQPALPTIQSELEAALSKLSGVRVRVDLASRTDAGVHARGQVVSFNTDGRLPLKAYVHGLNGFLPSDIAVRSARTVDLNFDPRRHAGSRADEYFLVNRSTRLPLWQNRAYQVPGGLDLEYMNQACRIIVGKHDFTSFTSNFEKSKSAVRYVFSAGVRREGELVMFRIAANAFLPHQVRYIAGTLIRVGQRRLSVDEFGNILEACQPALAGPVAPACGLYLNRIEYAKYFKEETDENL